MGTMASGFRQWIEAHPGELLDPQDRMLLDLATRIDFMSSNPLGVDTCERVRNGFFIFGAASFGLSVGADLAIEGATLTTGQKVLLKGLGAGSVIFGLSGNCSR
jgi:hypothetical protein